ncbi:MAG: ribonuclease R [Bacteroidales bacterium]|jgi:ribonuclease R|nr:ribonuclease R [Bacteroidales bacterium]
MTKKTENRKRKSNTNENKNSLSKTILGIFANNPTKTYNYKQIAKKIGINSSAIQKQINNILPELVKDNKISEIYKGKYKLKSKAGYIIGKVDLTQKGAGFIVCEDMKDDIFVSQSNLNQALNGDLVKVYLYAQKKSEQAKGEVVEIIERSKKKIIGIIEISENYAFVVSPKKQMPYDIFIPQNKLKKAKTGQKVVVRITHWPKKFKNPFGEIVEVLGNAGDNETEMHAILAEYDLPIKFPEKIENEANKISDKITKEEIKERRDFRDTVTITIDPDDAKDFDDALSLKKLKNGNYEIAVHIADVSHYIKEDSILDHEAYDRGTSIYLVDRVIPMLPEYLSNGVCSLRPKEDKLCFSAVFEIDNNAKVKNEWFGKTIINSDKRFSYEDAQEIIDTGEGNFSEEVLIMNKIAQKLRKDRFDNGSIAFERVEVKFNLDEKGNPLGIFFKEHNLSNELVEEFMLLANRKVAEFVGKVGKNKKAKTFIYRIHDKPDPEKLERFSKFITKFGYNINTESQNTITNSVNKILKQVKGEKTQEIIETLAVRSMSKAEYSTNNIGHYGLAFDYYSHFTSPIRRYPDIMVHRLLNNYLNKGKSKNQAQYETRCKDNLEMEKRAAEAERASIKYKQVEFLKDRIGEEFKGIISGVTEWGVYVELSENKCEGLVHIRELDDDFYVFDEPNYRLLGKETKKTYQLGDNIKIKIARADLSLKQLDFVLA